MIGMIAWQPALVASMIAAAAICTGASFWLIEAKDDILEHGGTDARNRRVIRARWLAAVAAALVLITGYLVG